MKTNSYSRDEVSQHFTRWREAVDRRDLDQMYGMFNESARGGNSRYGIFEGRDSLIQFVRDNWHEQLPNRSLWHAIDGSRVVDKWCETLPGKPPAGRDYSYHGISELIYAGSGHWNFMYGIPDVIGLTRAYSQWCEDGHVETYGHIFPNIPK